MSYKSYAEIERDNQDIYEESLANESERLSRLVGKEIDVIKREGDVYGESEEVTFMYRNHEYSIVFLYGMSAGYNNIQFVEFIKEKDKELDDELKDMYSPKQALNNIRYHYFNGDREYNDIETERFWFERVGQELKDYELMKEIRITARFDLAQVNKEHKALEIIKERKCLFKGLSEVNQEEFDLLKEVLL